MIAYNPSFLLDKQHRKQGQPNSTCLTKVNGKKAIDVEHNMMKTKYAGEYKNIREKHKTKKAELYRHI